MKRRIIFLLGILCVVIIMLTYHFSYPIKSDQSNLVASVNQWVNRGAESDNIYKTKMYTPVILGKLTYIPIEVNEKLGYVHLEQGITGRYKTVSSSYGTGDFANGVVEIDGKKQLLFMGRNTSGDISKVEFTPDANHKYEIAIPKENVFFVYTDVDDVIEIGPVSFGKIELYNEEGMVITSNFQLGGSNIQ